MASGLKIFGLLLYKNLIVRKRHWRMTIFLQALVPIGLFALLQAVRDYSVQPPLVMNESTYYSMYTQEELMRKLDNDLNKVYYVPKNAYTEKIMESVRYCLGLLPGSVKGFTNETEMVNAYTLSQAKNPISSAVAIVFEQYNEPAIKYKIRHSWKIPNTLYQTLLGERLSTSSSMYFEMIPFTQVQMCIDNVLIKQAAPDSNIKMSIQRMPYPPYVKIDDADIVLRELISTFAVLAFVIPLCIEATYASKEKFIGVNVLMAINGVKLAYNLFSWLVIGILFSTIYVVPIIILFKNTFSKNVEAFLEYGNGFIFWLLFTIHVTHLITFGLHIAAYFSKPRFVTTFSAIIYIAALLLHENMVREEVFGVIPYFGIIFPNIMLYRLFEETNAQESKLIGIQWNNLFVPGGVEYGILGSPGFILLFSLLGAVIHFTLAIYINAILPGKYGVRKDPLYFLKCIKNKNKVALDDEAGEFDYDKVNEDFEPVLGGALTPGIQIRDLKKSYITSWLRKSKVDALRGVSVDFYKGQITALLGHNGAGKTTLMSILTGVTSEMHQVDMRSGIDIANETHNQVVERIKAFANETKLLVVDQEADDYFRENNIVIKGTMSNMKVIKTPERNPNSVEDRSDGSNCSVDENSVTQKSIESNDTAHSDSTIAVQMTTDDKESNMRENGNGDMNHVHGTGNGSLSVGDGTNNSEPSEPRSQGLNLTMSAKELREMLAQRKKYDPKKESIGFKDKFDIVQKL